MPIMGKFTYANGTRVEFEDRALAHLQVVIANKLRRGESFLFTWRDDASVGDGRSSVWVSPNLPLTFKFYGSRAPALNRSWVEALAHSANSMAGLHLVSEPPDEGPHEVETEPGYGT